MQISDSRPSATDRWAKRITYVLTMMMRALGTHWLALINLFLGLYIGLPLLAPVLMHAGYTRGAELIYTVFKPLCHQLPERSFFLYGDRWAYSYGELAQALPGGEVPLRYVGDPSLGYKVAVCERDVAIYLSMFLAGLLFAFVRQRLKPLSIRQFALFCLPMAIDGTGQLVGLWTSTWLSRVVTGTLFGLACVWLTFPYLEQGLRTLRLETTQALQQWKA